MVTAANVFLFLSVILLGFNCSVGYAQANRNGNCVVHQICHGGPSPQAFSELVSLVKEMNNKLAVMEKKLDAVCEGECSSKRCKGIFIKLWFLMV